MSFDPEENLLDESLRETFRDYHLPPAEHMHVWAGVEKRIATLAAPRQGLLSYQLVLPLTAALGVGVAVGWLLPRPASPPPPPQTVPAVHATTWAAMRPAAVPQVAPAPVALPAPASTLETAKMPASSPFKVSAKPRVVTTKPAVLASAAVARPVVALVSIAPVPAASYGSLASDTACTNLVASLSEPPSGEHGLPAVAANTTAALPASAERSKALASEAPVSPEAVEHATKAAKPDRVNERMLYRKPTHRQPERGVGGIRRWFSHLTQGIRHLFLGARCLSNPRSSKFWLSTMPATEGPVLSPETDRHGSTPIRFVDKHTSGYADPTRAEYSINGLSAE